MEKKSSITVRPAKPEDSNAIARVLVDTRRVVNQGLVPAAYLDGLAYEKKEMEYRAEINEPAKDQITLVGATSEDRIVGFINGRPTVDAPGENSIELKELYILPAFQRIGLGRALVHEFLTTAKDNGIESIYVWILSGNPNRIFYENLGASYVDEAEREIGGERCKLTVYAWSKFPISGKK